MTESSFDEPAAWAAARSGDPSAWGELFEAHRDRVLGHALRLTRSLHDAEDVTGMVFLEAWRRRDVVREVNGSIIGWLLVTANNIARNGARSQRRFRAAIEKLPKPEHETDFAPELLGRIDDDPRHAAVRAAFAALSSKDQDVISLCVLEEMTMTEAARVLGVPLGTVKARLSRAKVKLAKTTADDASLSSALGGVR